MKRSLVLFREESRLPRLITWPLVLIGAGALSWAAGSMDNMERKLFLVAVIGAVPWVLLSLEFFLPVIEVRETELRFSFLPFYRRRVSISDIEHWTIMTYPRPVQFGRGSWMTRKHCAEFTRKDGSVFTITLAHPERLAEAVERAKASMHSTRQYVPSSAKAE
jgi:hypothetical protein